PAGEVKVALAGVIKMFLDSDQLLLTDKAVPTAQRLGVLAAVRIVLCHILTHDRCRVPGDIKASTEAVLQAHASGRFRVDVIPGTAVLFPQLGQFSNFILNYGHGSSSGFSVAMIFLPWVVSIN